MISIRRRGKVWQAHWIENGIQHRKSLHTRDPQIAAALARKIEMQLLTGKRFQPITWEEFAEEFIAWYAQQVRPSTVRIYRIAIRYLTAYFARNGIRDLSEINSTVIVKFIAERSEQLHPTRRRPMTEGGIRHELHTARRIFSYAVDRKYIPENPVHVRKMQNERVLTQPFSQEQIDKMFADEKVKESAEMQAILMTFLHTGLRKGDVRDLRKDAVPENTLMTHARKNSKLLSLEVHPELRAALDAHLAAMNKVQRESPLMFANVEGNASRTLYDRIRRLCKRVGIPDGHPHRFRDTFAVRLLSKGASLYDVAKLLGINLKTAEKHYSPWVNELRARGTALISSLDFAKSVQGTCSTIGQKRPLSTKKKRKKGNTKLAFVRSLMA